MTLKELAAACGLSSSAVSKALNGYSDVSAETRAFVQAKATELGYKPSAVARALKSGYTHDIGVFFEDLAGGGLTHSYFGPVMDSFKNMAETLGYEITFVTHNVKLGGMTYLEHCRSRGFDGVCIVNYSRDNEEINELVKSEIPLVSVDYRYGDRCCIASDNDVGIVELTRHIVSMGHKRIAYVMGEDTGVTVTRRNGFINEMKANGLEVRSEYLVPSRYHDPSAARSAVDKLLNLPEPPTCIMMSDDLAALGGLEAIREKGLRIPDDISIVGYDGVRLLQLCRPCLTTYVQDTEQIGSEAAKHLVSMIEHPEQPIENRVTVSGHIHIGDTVKRI